MLYMKTENDLISCEELKELQGSLTERQFELLIKVADQCKAEDTIAVLWAVLLVDLFNKPRNQIKLSSLEINELESRARKALRLGYKE